MQGRNVFLALAAALALACDSTNPVAPAPPQAPQPGAPAGAYKVVITAEPAELTVGAGTPSAVTVAVTRQADGQPPPDGMQVAVNTSLGSFGNDGAGQPLKLTTLPLAGGRARTSLFPGDQTGTAHLLAQFEASTGVLNVPVVDPVVPPFFLASIAPPFGSAAGGTQVTISGQGFKPPLRVTFGDALSAIVSVDPEGRSVVVTTPASPAPVPVGETRTVAVAVTIELDQPMPRSDMLAGAFTYTNGATVDRPFILSVSPPVGPNEGGTAVTIQGGNFEPDVQVFFGFQSQGGGFEGAQAAVTSATPTTLRVTSPRAATLGQSLRNRQVDVLVRNTGSGFQAIAPGAFKYEGEQILISGLTPLEGPYRGGTEVTVTGQAFNTDRAKTSVEFGGTGQQIVSVSLDGGTILARTVPVTVSQCMPPKGPLKVIDLETGDTATSPLVFSYTAPKPVILSISPTSGPPAGGEALTVSGTSFETGVRVELGGMPVPGATVTDASAAGVGTNIAGTVPAFTGAFDEDPCDDDGDGHQGKRFRAKAVDVKVTKVETGCGDTFAGAYTYVPADLTCRGDVAGPPEAMFERTVAGQEDCPAGQRKVFFDDTSTGNPTRWTWDFGDGTGQTLLAAPGDTTHCYLPRAERYLVRLTVSNPAGSDTAEKDVEVSPP